MHHWVNWSGGVRAAPRKMVEIADEAQLAQAILHAPGPVRVAGSGHSFSPLVETEGTILHLTGLTGVAEDRAGIRAGTGIVLADLTARMHALGHALANMGDVDGQRLGGALATATHGTGPSFGTYSAMLREFSMLDGQGRPHVLSRDRDETAFRAMAVSLGTGGVLTEALISTVPAYRLARRRHVLPLAALIEDFSSLMRRGRNTEFYYIPHSGAVMGLESEATLGALQARPPDRDQEGLRQLRLMARFLSRRPRLRRWIMSRLMLSHSAERFTEDWHRAYPTARDAMRFEETEWHLPLDAGPSAIAQVVQTIERHFPQVFFPIEIRLTGADDLFLSPFQHRECVSIAVHHEAGHPFEGVLAAVEPIFLRAGGRPHWGKRHTMTAAELRPMYPDWDLAIEARRHFDPAGRFVTPYLRQLLGL